MSVFRGDRRARGRGVCALVRVERTDHASEPALTELQEALLRKGVDVFLSKGMFDAMAQAVMHEGRRSRGETPEPFIVVFVDTPGSPECERMVQAASRFAPQAVFWEYAREPEPRLTAWVPGRARSGAVEAEWKGGGPASAPGARRGVEEELSGGRAPGFPSSGYSPSVPGLRLARTEAEDGEDGPRSQPREWAADDLSDSRSTGGVELTREELAMLLADDGES